MARAHRKADPFAAIADPTRRRLLERLKDGERSVQDLTGGLGMTMAGVSLHLQTLHQAGLVTRRVAGRQRLYRLDPRPLRHVAYWAQDLADFWTKHIDLLEVVIDETHAAADRPQD